MFYCTVSGKDVLFKNDLVTMCTIQQESSAVARGKRLDCRSRKPRTGITVIQILLKTLQLLGVISS